jgi:hypothetical protein
MNSLSFLLAPLALLVPLAVQAPGDMKDAPEAAGAAPAPEQPPIAVAGGPAPFAIFEDARRTPLQQQVRIEQRVIIRIAPNIADMRQRLMPETVRQPPEQRFKEEHLKGCVPIEDIAALQPAADNRLVLLMRDRRLLSAQMERSCNSREFYSGAYVERNGDGQLCPRRERLQSRTGASCQVAKLSRLVARRD